MNVNYRLSVVVLIIAVLCILSAGQAKAELLIHYKMDAIYNDGTNDMMADYSSYGSDGTLENYGAAGSYSIVSGIIGAGSLLTDQYTSVAASNEVASQLNNTFTYFSYAFWANPDTTTPAMSWDFIGKTAGSSAKGWGYRENPAWGTRVLHGGDAYTSAWNPQANPELYIPENKFTHIAVTFDGTHSGSSKAALYINGMSYTLDPNGTYFPTYVDGENSAAFQAGNSGIGSQGFPGAMDDVGVWNVTLDDQQIALIHGLGRFVGVDLGNSEIGDVLDAFQAGSGNSAVAGGYAWEYTTGLSGIVGAINTGAIDNPEFYVANGSAYIVLDNYGNGMLIGEAVPEPSTLVLLVCGFFGFLAYAWKKMK